MKKKYYKCNNCNKMVKAKWKQYKYGADLECVHCGNRVMIDGNIQKIYYIYE